MDANTAQHIRETFYAAICFVSVVVAWLYLSHRATDHGPTNWAKWKAFFRARYFVTSHGGGSAKNEPPTELVRADPVRPDTHQAEPEKMLEENDAPILPISHNMDNHTLTLILAAQKTPDGKPRWSANEIVKWIGGTRQDVLDTIAIVRPREKPVEEAPAKPQTKSPIAGRPINPGDFQDDLELRYQAP